MYMHMRCACGVGRSAPPALRAAPPPPRGSRSYALCAPPDAVRVRVVAVIGVAVVGGVGGVGDEGGVVGWVGWRHLLAATVQS